MGSPPMNTVVLVLLAEIISPYFDTMFSDLRTDFCSKVLDSANVQNEGLIFLTSSILCPIYTLSVPV
jgi:hypothetical protein